MTSDKKDRSLTSRDVRDLLEQHSDALASGRELDPDVVEKFPQSEQGLLGLNRQLSQSMPRVEPSGSYVSSLRERLGDSYSIAREAQIRHARQMRAAIGTGIGALLVIALVVPVIGAIIMLVNLTRTRRRNEQLKTSP